MGCVGGELDLSLAGALDRRADAPTDDQRAEEDGQQEHRSDEQLRGEDVVLGGGDVIEGLADDDVRAGHHGAVTLRAA